MDIDFTSRRSRSLARVCGYTLLVLFLFAVVAAVLPLQLGNPSWGFRFLIDLLERSTLPVVAIFLLFHGLSGDSIPAVWEVRLVARFRPLLRFIGLLYLLTILAIFGLGQQVVRQDMARLDQQLETSQKGIAQLRQAVEAAPDVASLRRLLAAQPAFDQVLRQEGSASGAAGSLQEQKRRLALLVERAEANLGAQNLVLRANTSGNFLRQAFRLSLSSLALGLCYLAAAQIWPRSSDSLVISLREQERRRAEEEEAVEVVDLS